MENLAFKVKISALWIFVVIAGLLHIINVTPEEQQWLQVVIQQPGTLLFWTILDLVALAMVVLSVTLKDSANRRINLVIGVIFLILYIGHPFGCEAARSSAHQILITISTIVVPLLIVWYAWKWPKEEA